MVRSLQIMHACIYRANGTLHCAQVTNEPFPNAIDTTMHRDEEAFTSFQNPFSCRTGSVTYTDTVPTAHQNAICEMTSFDVSKTYGVLLARNVNHYACRTQNDPKNPGRVFSPAVMRLSGSAFPNSFVVPMDENGIRNATAEMSIALAKGTAFNLAVFIRIPEQNTTNSRVKKAGFLRIVQCFYTDTNAFVLKPEHFQAYAMNTGIGSGVTVEAIAFNGVNYERSPPNGSSYAIRYPMEMFEVLRTLPLLFSRFTPAPQDSADILNLDSSYAQLFPDNKLAWMNMSSTASKFIVTHFGDVTIGKSDTHMGNTGNVVRMQSAASMFAVEATSQVDIASRFEPKGYTVFAVINPKQVQNGRIMDWFGLQLFLHKDGVYSVSSDFTGVPRDGFPSKVAYLPAEWQVVAFRIVTSPDPSMKIGMRMTATVFDNYCSKDTTPQMPALIPKPQHNKPGSYGLGVIGNFIGEFAHIQAFSVALSDENIRGHIGKLCERWGIRHRMKWVNGAHVCPS